MRINSLNAVMKTGCFATRGVNFQYYFSKFHVYFASNKQILNIAMYTHLPLIHWTSKCGHFDAILRTKLSFFIMLIDCTFRRVTDSIFAYIFFKVYTANKGKADGRQKARI